MGFNPNSIAKSSSPADAYGGVVSVQREVFKKEVNKWDSERIEKEIVEIERQLRAAGGNPDAVFTLPQLYVAPPRAVLTTVTAGRTPRIAARKSVQKTTEAVSGLVRHCFCRGKYSDSAPMIQCDLCSVWYHQACVGLTQVQSTLMDTYHCNDCLNAKKKKLEEAVSVTPLKTSKVKVAKARRTGGKGRTDPVQPAPPRDPCRKYAGKSRFQFNYCKETLARNLDRSQLELEIKKIKAELASAKDASKVAEKKRQIQETKRATEDARLERKELARLEKIQAEEAKLRDMETAKTAKLRHAFREQLMKHEHSGLNNPTERPLSNERRWKKNVSGGSESDFSSSSPNSGSDAFGSSESDSSSSYDQPSTSNPKSLGKKRVSDTKSDSGNDMTLILHMKKVMSHFKLSQKKVAADASLIGGATALSSWLNNRPIHKAEEKEKQIRAWLKKWKKGHAREFAAMESASSVKVPQKPSSKADQPVKEVMYKVGTRVDFSTSDERWVEAVISDTAPGQLCVDYPSKNEIKSEWIASKAGRIAELHSRSRGPGHKTHRKKHRHGQHRRRESVHPKPTEAGPLKPSKQRKLDSRKSLSKKPSNPADREPALGFGTSLVVLPGRNEGNTSANPLSRKRKSSAMTRSSESKRSKLDEDVNDSYCSICRDGGTLLCCDTCPRSFHGPCLRPPVDPSKLGDRWSCSNCKGRTTSNDNPTDTKSRISREKSWSREQLHDLNSLSLSCLESVRPPTSEVKVSANNNLSVDERKRPSSFSVDNFLADDGDQNDPRDDQSGQHPSFQGSSFLRSDDEATSFGNPHGPSSPNRAGFASPGFPPPPILE